MKLPTVVKDTREPDEAAGDTPEAVFRPAILVKGQRVDLPVERRKLDQGDYSLAGLEHQVAIERKSVSDMLGTLFGTGTSALGEAAPNLDRFRDELERLRGYPYRRIVVEGTPASLWAEAKRAGRRFDPRAAYHIILAIDVDYGAPVLWAGSREGAELLVGFVLARIWEQHTGGEAAKKAAARGYAQHLPWLTMPASPPVPVPGPAPSPATSSPRGLARKERPEEKQSGPWSFDPTPSRS